MLRIAKCYESIIQRNSDLNSEREREKDLMTRCAVIHFACISLNHPLNRAVTEQKASRVYSALFLFIWSLQLPSPNPTPARTETRTTTECFK